MLYLVLPSILPSNLPSVRFRVNPWQMLYLVLPSILPSVRFRVNPWQMLTLVLPSILPSVRFRVNPWQMLYLVLALFHTHKAPKFTKLLAGHLVIKGGRKIIENFTRIMVGTFATLF